MDNRFMSFGLVVQPPDIKEEEHSDSKQRSIHNYSLPKYDNASVNRNNSTQHRNNEKSSNKSLRNDEYASHKQPFIHDPVTLVPLVTKLQKECVEEVFAEMVTNTPSDRDKILVVLDCANIGWAYGVDVFNATGIKLALDYFRNKEVEVQAFIPASYLRKRPNYSTSSSSGGGNNRENSNALMMTDDVSYLNDIAGSSELTVVPSGDHDDAYILNFARDHNGFVVSNDFFSDYIGNIANDQVKTSMKIWLHGNRCGYTFVHNSGTGGHSVCSEFLPNPASKLTFCLGNERIWSLTADRLRGNSTGNTNNVGSSVNAVAGVDKSEKMKSSLKTLTEAATQLMELERGVELKHTLLARVGLLLEAGLREEAAQDLRFILQRLDPDCAVAKEFVQRHFT